MSTTRAKRIVKLLECPCTGRNLDKLIQPAVLALLAGESMHGYRLVQRLGREPSIEEIAEEASMSVSEARRVLKISRHPISLDRPVGESEDSYFGDFIEDETAQSPIETAGTEMLKDRIEEVLKTLTYREREIIKLRYGIGDGYTYTLEEVGRIFKVTRERVRQVEAKAIRKLQHPVRARKLEGFLDGSIYATLGAIPTTDTAVADDDSIGDDGGDEGHEGHEE